MKVIFKLSIVVLLLGMVSCRDTKKEDAESQAVVEKIETMETEVEEISDNLEAEEKELEEALKELDSI
ncbi:hypothetical protein [Ulvibacter antarcticus]|uniref:Uncharacterized protein n=1 Tax=Ulvibacter antarcticus TaxID=442714 RepID=A0A3L9YVX7_9FLAO|nr:hypothetical protein [Ulvibacter antarcticus]RMA58622.1 hypothetical protein BXY75_1996 [Ulvibacter antarcticus]